MRIIVSVHPEVQFGDGVPSPGAVLDREQPSLFHVVLNPVIVVIGVRIVADTIPVIIERLGWVVWPSIRIIPHTVPIRVRRFRRVVREIIAAVGHAVTVRVVQAPFDWVIGERVSVVAYAITVGIDGFSGFLVFYTISNEASRE